MAGFSLHAGAAAQASHFAYLERNSIYRNRMQRPLPLRTVPLKIKSKPIDSKLDRIERRTLTTVFESRSMVGRFAIAGFMTTNLPLTRALSSRRKGFKKIAKRVLEPIVVNIVRALQ